MLRTRNISYTMLRTRNMSWHRFCSLIRNIVKKRKWEKQEIVQIEAFAIVFVTDCPKESEKFQIGLFTAGRLFIISLWNKI